MRSGDDSGSDGDKGRIYPLFETKTLSKTARSAYRLFSISMFTGIAAIWTYRISNIKENWSWSWMLLLLSDFWFGFYWVLTQSVRWNPVHRSTSKHQLSLRYGRDLPGVDVFVCTADPIIEPPMMVINTVLSVMAYDYPTDKLSVYLSDDGGSELTFYALLEASEFSRHWIPFCRKFNIEPRSPGAYFSGKSDGADVDAEVLSSIKRLYKEMELRIETATKSGRLPEAIRSTHTGFSEWTSGSSQRDHPTILQVLIDSGSPTATDITGVALPTLVYLAREKRPARPHHFKAGAMNALIRVSSKISNGKFILNVDCDMYSNNSECVRDALCFFMDEQKGHEIAFVQFPQLFNNITKNDIYGSSMIVIHELDFPGLDGYGGPLYIGTGCFHRRETLCGRKYGEEYVAEDSTTKPQQPIKFLADCNFEDNTEWGNQKGLKYGCPTEDVTTGLAIHSRGWKSVYFKPLRAGFLGIAPTTLGQTLVQHKRWSEGDLQILLSRFGPLSRGTGKIKLGHKMGYCIYCLWAVNCLATLCYSIVPPLYLLKGIPLFPRISSPWFVPFAYVIIGEIIQSVVEFIGCGGTLRGWWNEQRIWMFKRTTSYFFGFVDNVFKLFGFSNSAFNISVKVVENEVSQRYEKEMMEFGHSSSMFIILATLALINLFGLVGGVVRMVMGGDVRVLELVFLQVVECVFVVALNLPVYQALFLRKDSGRLPASVAAKSTVLALSACTIILY